MSQLGFEPRAFWILVRHSYQLSHWDSGIGVEDIWHIYLYPGKPYYERRRQGNITWRTLMTQYRGKYRAISREICIFPWKLRYFPRNWTTASLLAGYTANYTARCQSFSLPRSSGDIRGSWRPKRSLLDAASSRHKASLCAGILSSCRLSHGKPVS